MSESNGYVTREQWKQRRPRRFKDVTIEGFGKVRIRNLTEAERIRWEQPNISKKGVLNLDKLGDSRCRLLIATVVDASGEPMLTTDDIADMRLDDSLIVNQLADEIAKHCGISEADMEALEKKQEIPAISSQ